MTPNPHPTGFAIFTKLKILKNSAVFMKLTKVSVKPGIFFIQHRPTFLQEKQLQLHKQHKNCRIIVRYKTKTFEICKFVNCSICNL